MEIAVDKNMLLVTQLHGKENKVCPEKPNCMWNAVGIPESLKKYTHSKTRRDGHKNECGMKKHGLDRKIQ